MTLQQTIIQSENESQLARLCAEISEKLRAGKSVDLKEYATSWPQHMDELRQLLPAMQALVRLPDELPNGKRAVFENALAEPIGDFQILRQIGRGGMGVVYEAIQLSLGRRVALKVLPMAGAMDERQLARFKNEAMAAAGLNHHHIVPVYAVGAERGVHYFAMQLIDGQNLAEVVTELRIREGLDQPADAARELPTDSMALQLSREEPVHTEQAAVETVNRVSSQTRPRNGRRSELTAYFRNVAQLAKDAAEALAFAHEEGLIHRDVKPSNLMLDAAGKVWVTDFGLARTQAAAGMTMTGDLIGTLRYMSPEQAMGNRAPVDQRTDQYSLGATLYELLTLQPMVSGDGQVEIIRNVTSVEPPPLRRLRPEIPVDLETIVLKAVSKSLSDRYLTMLDFAEDLNRFLRNEPIKAKPLSMVDRGARFVRRHILAFVGALAVTMLMVAGLGIAFWLTWLARVDAVAKGQALQRRQEQTTKILGCINRTVDTILDLAQSLPEDSAISKAIAEEQLAFTEELRQIDGDNPIARFQMAISLLRMANNQYENDELEEAETNVRKVIVISEELAAAEPNSHPYAHLLCAAWSTYASIATRRGQVNTAADRVLKSIQYGEQAITQDRPHPSYRHGLAEALNIQGYTLAHLGRGTEASQALDRAIVLLSQNVAENPHHWQFRDSLARAHWLFVEMLFVTTGDLTLAKTHVNAYVSDMRFLQSLRPDDVSIRQQLGVGLVQGYAMPGFSTDERQTMRIEIESFIDGFPLKPESRFLLNDMARYCTNVDATTDEKRLAIKLCQKVVALSLEAQDTIGKDDSETCSQFWSDLGLAHYRSGNFVEALEAFAKSSSFGYRYTHDIFVQAMCYHQLAQHDQAVKHFNEAVTIMQANIQANDLADAELIALRQEAAQLLGIDE